MRALATTFVIPVRAGLTSKAANGHVIELVGSIKSSSLRSYVGNLADGSFSASMEDSNSHSTQPMPFVVLHDLDAADALEEWLVEWPGSTPTFSHL